MCGSNQTKSRTKLIKPVESNRMNVYQQLNWISWINSNYSAVSNLSIQSNLTNWIKSSQLNKSNKTYWSNWRVATLLFPFKPYFSVHKHFRIGILKGLTAVWIDQFWYIWFYYDLHSNQLNWINWFNLISWFNWISRFSWIESIDSIESVDSIVEI